MWREEDHPRDKLGRFDKKDAKDIHEIDADEIKSITII